MDHLLLTYLVTGIRAVSLASVEGGAKAELMTLFISGYIYLFCNDLCSR